jgi:transcriptional regulator GlxA family with amidase domain
MATETMILPIRRTTDARIRMVQSMAHRQTQRRLSLDDLGETTGLSTSRLSHLFRSQTGMPPKQYLKLVRLQRARELFETTLLSVKEVAAQVGAHDVSHFVRDFESSFGLSPARYRLRFSRLVSAPAAAEIAGSANE